MATRITTSQLAARLDAQENTLAEIASAMGTLVSQFSTPAPVAEVVAEAAPVTAKATRKANKAAAKQAKPVAVVPAQPVAPVAETKPAPVTAVAGDALQEFVTGKALAFAKGGRTYLDNDALQGIARVLKTGNPEIVTITSESLNKRGIVGLAIGRDGNKGVLTQYVYDPTATRN